MCLSPDGEYAAKVAPEVDRVQVEVHSKGQASARQERKPEPGLQLKGHCKSSASPKVGVAKFLTVKPIRICGDVAITPRSASNAPVRSPSTSFSRSKASETSRNPLEPS